MLVSSRHSGLLRVQLHVRALCWSLVYTVALCLSVALSGRSFVSVLHRGVMLFSYALGS